MADGLQRTETDGKALPGVYAAIAAVMADIGKSGIAKARRNDFQKYDFRGIDDVYNALAPLLAKHSLIIVPRVVSREKSEYASKGGGVNFYVVVEVAFDIICATDGSCHVACTWGEAMDSGDKATNKAMSAAYKYMAMQTFCIPTEGDNDADASSPEIVPERVAERAPADRQPTASKADSRGDYGAMVKELRGCRSLKELQAWGAANAQRIKVQPTDWQRQLRGEYADMLDGFRQLEEEPTPVNGDGRYHAEIPL